MAFSWGRTYYTEFVGERGLGQSPIVSLANDASWATRVLDTNWLTQRQAGDDFVGWGEVASTGMSYPNPSAYIRRSIPMWLPFYYEQIASYTDPSGIPVHPSPVLWCTKINRIQGVGFAGFAIDAYGNPLAAYQIARMELGFETLSYDILPDSDPRVLGAGNFPDEATLTRYVTKVPSPSADYISLNQGVMLYAEGPNRGSVVPFQPGKILVSHDLRYRWEVVPKEAVPSLVVNPLLSIGPPSQGNGAQIEYCLGKVNDNWFPPNATFPTSGFAPGSLLLTAAAIIPIRGPTGRRLFAIEYFFKFLPTLQHKIFGPLNGLTGGFIEISTDGNPHPIMPTTPDGVHIYDVADFRWLFRPPISGTSYLVAGMPPPDMTVTLRTVPEPP